MGLVVNILSWLIIGAIAGYVASLILGNSKSQNRTMDIIIGIAGAFIGGFIANLVGLGPDDANNIFSPIALIVAIGGATLLLFLKGMFLK